MRPLQLPLALITALLIGAAPAQPAAAPNAADRIRAHVEFLAHDRLQGRDTGSVGYAIAADYVARQFEALGLRPGGENGGWYQSVPFRRATHADAPKMSLTVKGRRVGLVVGKDAAVRPSLTERKRSIAASLVFVGHGISDPRLGIDDYADLDVRGKIAIALSDGPAGIPSDVAAHLRVIQAETAAAHGAIGFVEISDPRQANGRVERFATRPVIDWVDPVGRTGGAGAVRATIAMSPDLLKRLFKGARMSLDEVQSQARSGNTVRGFPLPARLTLASRSDWSDFRGPEVVGMLPGSDPVVSRECIILSAHLDHLGIKTEAKGGEDAVYNGALDNAAGVATMLEAVRHFVRSGRRPRRSVMFIAHTGEEVGLLGASYFAVHPTIPIDQVVGLVNLDMPLLLYDFTDVIAFGAEHSTIARAVAAAGASMRVAVSPDPMPQESLFVRSDHYPFVKRGVPAVFLMTGHANGGKQAWERFLSDVYHKPNDDLAQPINWRAAKRFAELNYRIARTLADGERPLWYAHDYFGDSFAPTSVRATPPLVKNRSSGD